MIFLIAKIKTLLRGGRLSQPGQAGVSLLLAVLILAAITAIAFSLAAITTIELRSSSDVLRTEPIVYAVQAVTEEAFFQYNRYVPSSDLDVTTCQPVSLRVCNLNSVDLSQPTKPATRQFDPAPRVDVIPISTTISYLFFDPTKPSDFGQLYNSITVTQLNSVSGAQAKLSRCCDTFGNTQLISTTSLSQNSPVTLTLGAGQYDLAIQNSSATTPLVVQLDAIKTTVVSGQCSSPCHLLPLLGKVLDISASYLGLTRKYTVSIPSK